MGWIVLVLRCLCLWLENLKAGDQNHLDSSLSLFGFWLSAEPNRPLLHASRLRRWLSHRSKSNHLHATGKPAVMGPDSPGHSCKVTLTGTQSCWTQNRLFSDPEKAGCHLASSREKVQPKDKWKLNLSTFHISPKVGEISGEGSWFRHQASC